MNTRKGLEKKLSARNIRDLFTRVVVYIGGGSVLIALASMFVYLGYEVIPLFSGASVTSEEPAHIEQIWHAGLLDISLEEQNQITTILSSDGEFVFYSNKEKYVTNSVDITDETIASVDRIPNSNSPIYAFGTVTGKFGVAQARYTFNFREDGNSTVSSAIVYPLENTLYTNDFVSEQATPIDKIAVAAGEDKITVILKSGSIVALSRFIKEESFLGDDNSWEREDLLINTSMVPDYIMVDQQQKQLFLITASGNYAIIDLEQSLSTIESGTLIKNPDETITQAIMLAGSGSIVFGTSSGRLEQWFPVRQADNTFKLTFIRDFETQDSAITDITAEHSRKGFIVTTEQGVLSFLYSTSNKVLYKEQRLSPQKKSFVAISPRANAVITVQNGNLTFYEVHNEHPEVSMSSLWAKVWYEGYPKPDFVWQSSSASSDFEPKFSFAPLVFGTIKAAFYAMLFALPIGILAGAYTAHFMAPGMRKIVKPTVEIMAALPTVILGFLAGLWLAPFIESHLTGIFAAPIIIFTGVVVISLVWHILPKRIRIMIPEGYEFALLVPVMLILLWLSFELSPFIEQIFFGGDARHWLTHDMGIDFDQRNSIIIGITMGIAVIPNVFSITEDAVFSVPRSLTNGSLALGATAWQTMTRVVIQTASPAIFSAVMIGLGRAIGETMIVLMATGNTPIMNFNIFEGMRTLAANIAVEMPEAEVGSTHFRLLFLSAFTLFILTFFFNTLSEVVSTRLRKKFSSL